MSERETLLGFLTSQREAVVWKLQDVTDVAARSVETSTGLHLHGLLRHLEHVERWWVRDVFAGQKELPYAWTDEDPDGELHVPTDVTMASLLADYEAEIVESDKIIDAHDLDDMNASGEFSLRWVVVHLIEETARHLGHIDILREQADGSTGFGPERSHEHSS